jgi:hypothetical protein
MEPKVSSSIPWAGEAVARREMASLQNNSERVRGTMEFGGYAGRSNGGGSYVKPKFHFSVFATPEEGVESNYRGPGAYFGTNLPNSIGSHISSTYLAQPRSDESRRLPRHSAK